MGEPIRRQYVPDGLQYRHRWHHQILVLFWLLISLASLNDPLLSYSQACLDVYAHDGGYS